MSERASLGESQAGAFLLRHRLRWFAAWLTAAAAASATVSASGCSSTPEAPTTESGAEPTPSEASAEVGPPSCPTTVPIGLADIGLKWFAPGPSQNACNQANLDALKAAFASAGGSAKYSDIETSLGPTCSACVFTVKSADRWGLIIKDGAAVVADNSLGACFGELSTAACGKARFEIDYCLDMVCPQATCGTDTKDCNTKALKGACETFLVPYTAACPEEETLIRACASFARVIEVVCGGGPDAGLDAGF